MQSIRLKELFRNVPRGPYVPDALVADFNFDGHVDFAIVEQERSGPYGANTYAALLYSPRYRSFVYAEQLTRAGRYYFGFFSVAADKKRLLGYSKSGCCIHWTDEYALIGNVPRRMRSTTRTDEVDDSCTLTTEVRRSDGHWEEHSRPCRPGD